jgi:glycosyltransferase involved in cell wall biosynthesis
VLRLLGEPDYARELGERGYTYAREYFDWDRIMDQYDAIYSESISSARPPSVEEGSIQTVTT